MILRMRQADVGFGQQFFGGVAGDLAELGVDPAEAEARRIGLDHADAGELKHGVKTCLAVPQRLLDFPEQQERDLLLANDCIHFVVLQNLDDGLRRGQPDPPTRAGLCCLS